MTTKKAIAQKAKAEKVTNTKKAVFCLRCRIPYGGIVVEEDEGGITSWYTGRLQQ